MSIPGFHATLCAVCCAALAVGLGCGPRTPTASPLTYAEALEIRDREEAEVERRTVELAGIHQSIRETLAAGEAAKRKLAEHLKYDAFDEDKEAERGKIEAAKQHLESLNQQADAVLGELKSQTERFERAKRTVDAIRAKAEQK
jgi:hypothetical protein